jgi:hypothetical protein
MRKKLLNNALFVDQRRGKRECGIGKTDAVFMRIGNEKQLECWAVCQALLIFV